MSVTFDAKTDGNGISSLSSKTFTHTNVGTTNLVAFVGVGFAVLSANLSNPTCTYGGAAMTSVVSQNNTGYDGAVVTGQTRIFRKENPATGAQSVVLTWATGAVFGDTGAMTVLGADQTTASGNTNTASGSGVNTIPPTVTVASGNMAFDSLSVQDGAGSTAAGTQTLAYAKKETTGDYTGAGQYTTSTGTPTMGWSWTNNNFYTWCGCEIVAASGGGSRPVKMAGQWGGFAGESGGFAG